MNPAPPPLTTGTDPQRGVARRIARSFQPMPGPARRASGTGLSTMPSTNLCSKVECLRLTAFRLDGPTANSAPLRWNDRTLAGRANAVSAYHWEHGSGHKWAHGNIVTHKEITRNQGVLSSRGNMEGYSVIR